MRRARNAAFLRLICFQNQPVKVQPANAWHQPDDINVQKMLREIITSGITTVAVRHDDDGDVEMVEDVGEAEIHRLNDHCLMQIFKRLTVVDRVRIERGLLVLLTCSLKNLIQKIFKEIFF